MVGEIYQTSKEFITNPSQILPKKKKKKKKMRGEHFLTPFYKVSIT